MLLYRRHLTHIVVASLRRFPRPTSRHLLRPLHRSVERRSDRTCAMAQEPHDIVMKDVEEMPVAPTRDFQIVVALCDGGGIGFKGQLPWKVPADMKHFRQLTSAVRDPTKHNAVIMGRKTWESIPEKFRPLKDRFNIVLSRRAEMHLPHGTAKATSFDEALRIAASPSQCDTVENVFVIGGGEVFREVIGKKNCAALHMTHIEGKYETDVQFPSATENSFRLLAATAPIRDATSDKRCSFLVYVRQDCHDIELPPATAAKHEETQVSSCRSFCVRWSDLICVTQYLNCVSEIMQSGAIRDDRTGTGTMSKFGVQMRFNLRHSFPLLTTKKVFWRGTRSSPSHFLHRHAFVLSGVVEELLWFISGSTNAKVLQEKDIHIWDGASHTRQELSEHGRHVLRQRIAGVFGQIGVYGSRRG